MCKYTNVLPSHEPQDAYELVAIEARKLIGEEGWVALKVAGCIKGAEKAQKKRMKKDPNYVPTVQDFTFDVAQEWITRKVVKRPVMCTAYGASWKSKNTYVSDELNALYLKMFGEQGRKPSITECKVVTDAVIAGQQLAFPKQAEINEWFKSVAKAALAVGQDYVTWETVTGSRVVQEFREHITVQVYTHGMGGAKYDMKLKRNGSIEDGHRLSVSVGKLGDVISSKSQSALAANWTHSQDASVLQAAWEKMPQEHIFIVHDCAYAPAGKVDEMVNALKLSFLRVAGSNALDIFPAQNGVEDVIEPLEKGDVNLFDCLKSDYMFS